MTNSALKSGESSMNGTSCRPAILPRQNRPVNALAPWCGKAIFIVNKKISVWEVAGEIAIQRTADDGKGGLAMSTIEDVRAAEKKVQEVLDALKKADPQDLNHLSAELRNATDHYARAVRGLDSK